MKEFNLLKEDHGIRARLKELNSSDKRRINTGFIFISLLLVAVAVLSYAVYSISDFGAPTTAGRKILSPKSEPVPPADEAPVHRGSEVVESEPLKNRSQIVVLSPLSSVPRPPPPKKEEAMRREGKRFGIRVAACMYKESADAVQRDLKAKGVSSYIKIGSGSIKGRITNLYKVYVGDYNNKEEVLSVADKLKANGFSTIIEEKGE